MKIYSIVALASLGSVAAFTAPSLLKNSHSVLALRMAPKTTDNADVSSTTATKKMSKSIPFLPQPAGLDGSYVGDVGFDPLNFAKTKEDLELYREAELKHARLAMLAAAGWPLSELFDKKIAAEFNLKPVLDATDKAPSILNGGLDKISPIYWISVLVFAGIIDLFAVKKMYKNEPGYFPGNLNFDPLRLYPSDPEGQKRMQLAELKNGRLAMIAITGFAFQEFVTKLGVVDETPFFFQSLL